MVRLLALATLIVSSLLLLSCGGSEPAPATTPPPPSPPVTSPSSTPATATSSNNARALYAANCASCHGDNRQGMDNLGGALTPESLKELSDATIKETISEGRPSTAMPAWKDKLSTEEIDALIQFIKSTSP